VYVALPAGNKNGLLLPNTTTDQGACDPSRACMHACLLEALLRMPLMGSMLPLICGHCSFAHERVPPMHLINSGCEPVIKPLVVCFAHLGAEV
jgi:hypothetical protein